MESRVKVAHQRGAERGGERGRDQGAALRSPEKLLSLMQRMERLQRTLGNQKLMTFLSPHWNRPMVGGFPGKPSPAKGTTPQKKPEEKRDSSSSLQDRIFLKPDFTVSNIDADLDQTIEPTAPTSATISVKGPTVTSSSNITVDDKGDPADAAKWQLGYIQTARQFQYSLRYDTYSINLNTDPVPPIRDAFSGVPEPWYNNPTEAESSASISMSDRPRSGGSLNSRLQYLNAKSAFTTWLAARHIDTEEIEYLKNFRWGFDYTVNIRSAAPFDAEPTLNSYTDPAPQDGKGADTPKLRGPIANESFKATVD